MNKIKPAREVVLEFIEDYVAAAERLSGTLEEWICGISGFRSRFLLNP